MSKLTDFPVYSSKTKKRVKYGIFGSGLIVVLVMAALLTRSPALDTPPGKISVSMTAQVYRDGDLVAERVKDDDLLLNNFINCTDGLFAWPDNALYEVSLYSGDEGDYYDFVFWNTTASETIWDSSEFSLEGRLTCDLGTASNPPDRDDDNLDASFATYVVYDVSDLDTDSFTITFLWTSDGSHTWSETGLQRLFYSSDFPGQPRTLLARDTFTPIAVVLGDTLVTNYQFTFSSGYTANAINLMYVWILGSAQNLDKTATLTDSAGTSRTVRLYTDDPADTDFYGHVSNVNYGGWITISDSSSGIPSRTAYRLLGSSVTTQSTTVIELSPNYDVEVSATLIPSVAITVRAAGSFMYLAYVGGDAYFLMWALSHGGVYVAGGTPVQATFTLEL